MLADRTQIMTTTDTATQLEALRAHLAALDETRVDLRPMPDTGLAHDHVWISRQSGADWVARLPKQSQMRLAAEANLDYQAQCYIRAAGSGHTPELKRILPLNAALPRGGLLITAITGRPARLPEDLPAIARALASLHRLPPPAPAQRAPLANAVSPWQAMRDEVFAQARYLDALPPADLAAPVRRLLDDELQRFDASIELAERIDAHRCLISFDAHPGNFLITPDGQAVLVDLEKCRYSHPGFDLAHASLYTSTTWDPASHAVLDGDAVIHFYRHWQAQLGPNHPLADDAALLATRRAIWLWSVTWCAKWWSLHGRERDLSAQGEDWSTALSDPQLIAHVAERVAHYLSAPIVVRVVDETRYLQQRLTRAAA